MDKIILSPAVSTYLEQLIRTLYQKEYFGYKDSAREYVNKLIAEIDNSIYLRPHNSSTGRLKKYGPYYIFFSTNKRTYWFVFFHKNDDRFYVSYIINNHNPKMRLIR